MNRTLWANIYVVVFVGLFLSEACYPRRAEGCFHDTAGKVASVYFRQTSEHEGVKAGRWRCLPTCHTLWIPACLTLPRNHFRALRCSVAEHDSEKVVLDYSTALCFLPHLER